MKPNLIISNTFISTPDSKVTEATEATDFLTPFGKLNFFLFPIRDQFCVACVASVAFPCNNYDIL